MVASLLRLELEMPHGQASYEFVFQQWKALGASLIRWWTEQYGDTRPNILRYRLSPFMNWCVFNRIVAEEVTDKTITDYIASKPRAKPIYYRRQESVLRTCWNLAATRVPGWPAVFVSAPVNRSAYPTVSRGQIICLPKRQFHPALVAEVKRYHDAGGFLINSELASRASHRQRMDVRLKLLGKSHGDAPNAYPSRLLRALTPEVLYQQTRVIFRTATALILAGEADPDGLQRIADVITPRAAAILADSYEQRLGHDRGRLAAAVCVKYFTSIAPRCGIIFAPAERQAVRELLQDLYGIGGEIIDLSEANMRKLAQFDDHRKFAMLIALPDVMMAELERARRAKGFTTLREARRAKWAIAIEILNTLPIRSANLFALDLKRNFIKTYGVEPKLIVFASEEKTGKTLEAHLSARTWKLISLYRRHYRPLLEGANRSTYLFPALNKTGHVSATPMAKAMTRTVYERVGAYIHPHLWRHLMATKLGESTRRVEDAEKLLGHAPNSNSTKRYARLRSKAAADLLRDLNDAARSEGKRLILRRDRPRSPKNPAQFLRQPRPSTARLDERR
jgi:hypothetical protein